MSLASTLPLELVHTILEADYLTTDSDPDRRLLRSCSLVCNAWSLPAQRLLFANVVLRSEHDFHAFCSALRQPSLANSVRTLRVILDYNQPQGLRQHHLAAAVALCPRLNSINLSVFGSDSHDSGNVEHGNENSLDGGMIIEELDSSRPGNGASKHRRSELSLSLAETLNKSPITSFHLSNWSTSTFILPPLLASLPTLKYLSISGTPPASAPTASNPEHGLNLTHLRINFQQSPSVDALRWLLDNSKDTLTALDLERLSDSDASARLLDHLTTIHGPSLQSLILPSCTTPSELKHFQRCTNLHSVAFRTPYVSPAVFKHFLAEVQPAPLKEMYVCIDRNTALSPMIEFVRQKESLKTLVVYLWEADVRKKLRLWGSLKMACALRGVELKVVERLSEYKALIVCSFPLS
ncbi:hypothetical protein P691DRAFT_795716 [Macrolepiota fuliginosa MF-IS2]|uniref:F-box domain-containing protein n=1 Tax=Macrolepiota fuliginosa MF-IS2 TaxID=1400762 RepID=A0A9P5X6B0_9AGAR|nr:hypothetical protein P691DRAFT_795716 [Macrolepiota fuliginosa MF-IS2]